MLADSTVLYRRVLNLADVDVVSPFQWTPMLHPISSTTRCLPSHLSPDFPPVRSLLVTEIVKTLAGCLSRQLCVSFATPLHPSSTLPPSAPDEGHFPNCAEERGKKTEHDFNQGSSDSRCLAGEKLCKAKMLEAVVRGVGLRCVLQEKFPQILELNSSPVGAGIRSEALADSKIFIPSVQELFSDGKVYRVQLLPLYYSFLPRSLLLSTVKWTALSFAFIQGTSGKEEIDMEKMEKELPGRVSKGVVNEICVQTVKRILERIAIYNVEPRWAAKLLKCEYMNFHPLLEKRPSNFEFVSAW